MRADLVVIGAGALGLSTALHAALAGKSVVVVDAHAAGSQASGRAAGLFKSVQADVLRTWLARRSIERAISFADWAGAELEVVRSGSFLIARTDEHRAYLRTEASQSGGWGVDVSEASPGQLAEHLSYYTGDGRELALWCPDDVYIEEPMSLIRAYVAACRTHGVEIWENEPVTGITLSGGQVAGVQTTAQTIITSAAVDAAGAWTRQLADLAGGRVAVAPVRHQLAITEPTDAIDRAAPIVRVVDAAVYLRPARGGLMVGGFESAPLPVDPRGEAATFTTDDVPLDLSVLRTLAGQVAAEVPQASGALAEHRGGLFTMSPDGRFAAGPVPEVPGLWTITGCNGSGFSSSLGLGEALADWIVTGTSRIDELAPGRFGPMADEELVKAGIWQYAHYYDSAGLSPPALRAFGDASGRP
jgi:glycine/D-amino acid oxidase-like deaminating enzyme